MKIVYIEGVLMDNGEFIHFGKSLGFIGDRQKMLVREEATKKTRGGEIVVMLKGEDGLDRAA